MVFWVMTPHSAVVGFWYFGEPCCLHLQGENGGSTMTSLLPWKSLVSQLYTYQLLREDLVPWS